ncbi:MAG: hypothetical protein SGCHY_001001 [Lobulomycetales sp.]
MFIWILRLVAYALLTAVLVGSTQYHELSSLSVVRSVSEERNQAFIAFSEALDGLEIEISNEKNVRVLRSSKRFMENDEIRSLTGQNRSKETVVQDLCEIAVKEWSPLPEVERHYFVLPESARQALYGDLSDIRTRFNGFSGFYFSEGDRIVVNTAFRVSHFIKMGVFSRDIAMHFNLTEMDWIALLQIFDKDYQHLLNCKLLLSSTGRIDSTLIVDFINPFNGQDDGEILREIPELSTRYREAYESLESKPRNIPEARKALVKFLMNPSYVCAYCGKETGNVVSAKVLPCSDRSCETRHFDQVSSEALYKEIADAPILADLLITLLYSSANACKNGIFWDSFDPRPVGVGYFDNEGNFIGFTELQTRVEIAKYVLKVLNKLPAVDILLEMHPSTFEKQLEDIEMLLPPLLRWLFQSQYALLREIHAGDSEMVEGLEDQIDFQFKFSTANPANERSFQEALLWKDRFIWDSDTRPSLWWSYLLKLVRGYPVDEDVPTIYGFHGSAVSNYHSILRNGFNIDRKVNGRCYGHGVYHSNEFRISLGFTKGPNVEWPNSLLSPKQIVSVNEIVADYPVFVSTDPYIVVPPPLVRPRYLLVSSKSDNVDRIKLLIKNNSSSTGSKERLYETRSEKDPFPLQFEEVRRSGEFRRIRIPELVAWNTTAHEEEQQDACEGLEDLMLEGSVTTGQLCFYPGR